MKILLLGMLLLGAATAADAQLEQLTSLLGPDRKDEIEAIQGLDASKQAGADTLAAQTVVMSAESGAKNAKAADDPKAMDLVYSQVGEEIEKDLKSGEEAVPAKEEVEERGALQDDHEDDEEVPPGMFDFAAFLDRLEKLDCKSAEAREKALDAIEATEEGELTSLCEDAIHESLLDPMSRSDSHAVDLYNYLKKHIYLPLGLDIDTKFTYPEVLSDMFFVGEQSSMISRDTRIPTNEQFEREIEAIYRDMQNYSSDFEANKGIISAQVVDILKRFHIFWNVHRQRKQLNTVGQNTLEIIKQLIKRYRKTSAHMVDITEHILRNLQDGYLRFIRATKIQELIKQKPVEMIALQLIRRYKANVELIISGKTSREGATREIGAMLDLARGFWILNHKLGVSDEENLQRSDQGIVAKVKLIYDTYRKYLVENQHEGVRGVREFTATLLLKLHLRRYIIFVLYGLNGYMALPVFSVDNNFGKAARIYYEWIDNLMLIPGQCKDLLEGGIENCVKQKAFAIENELYQRYSLYASINGYDVLSFIRGEMKQLYEKASRRGMWGNVTNFRNFYFAEVFGISERYRQKYHVKDKSQLCELEEIIGQEIEKAKISQVLDSETYALLDVFDHRIYEFFLDLKSQDNTSAPDDLRDLTAASDRLVLMLDQFRHDNYDVFGPLLAAMLEKIKKISRDWILEVSHQVLFTKNGRNYEAPISQFVPVAQPNSDIVEHVVNEPMNASMMMMPVAAEVKPVLIDRPDKPNNQ